MSHDGGSLQHSCDSNRLVFEVILGPLVGAQQLGYGSVLGGNVRVKAEQCLRPTTRGLLRAQEQLHHRLYVIKKCKRLLAAASGLLEGLELCPWVVEGRFRDDCRQLVILGRVCCTVVYIDLVWFFLTKNGRFKQHP